jgi:AraC-like DNA-binding protein
MAVDRTPADTGRPAPLPPCGYWANRGDGGGRGDDGGAHPAPHRHEGCELVWVQQGQGRCITHRRTKSFSPGQALLIDATRDHAVQVHGRQFVRSVVQFDPDILSPHLVRYDAFWRDLQTYSMLKAEFCAAAHARVSGWFDALFAALGEAQRGGDAAITAYLQLILVEFDRHRGRCTCGVQPAGMANPHVPGAVLWYVENHLADAVTLDELARMLAISPRHLERRFKEATGASLKAFWTEKRMEQAAVVLRAGSAGVAEAARLVGYASPHAFSRAFKRHFGVPPSELRGYARAETPPWAGQRTG